MCFSAWSKSVVLGSLMVACAISSGCRSPYYADRGAAAGGLAGAGIGAIIGSQTGDPLAGAAIGGGIGALTGNVFGAQLDEIQAQNRAAIAAQMGRQVAPGAATIPEVVAMSRSGVDQRLIVNYINNSGVAQPVSAQDVIHMHQQGVATDVIQAMQSPRPPVQTAAAPAPVSPVIVEEHHYGPPPGYYAPPPRFHYHHYRHRPCHPRVGWGISISN